MTDITKARLYLTKRNSDMQHLESFGLMLATAEQRYRDIKLRQRSNRDGPGTWKDKEIEAALDFATLRYLKKYNKLPPNVSSVFVQGVSAEEKENLARQWANA